MKKTTLYAVMNDKGEFLYRTGDYGSVAGWDEDIGPESLYQCGECESLGTGCLCATIDIECLEDSSLYDPSAKVVEVEVRLLKTGDFTK